MKQSQRQKSDDDDEEEKEVCKVIMRATWQIKRRRIIAQHCYEIHLIAT